MLTPDSSQGTNTPPTDDWSRLREIIQDIKELDTLKDIEDYVDDLVYLVPKLLNAYAELWEMSMAMTQAWEKLEESKNSLYVPDANDMIQLHKDGEL